ncbi:hypothetical protein SOP92_05250 [Enterobacter ludwigii]|uniref:hypothetical protein n=1 Tax=Enterobacteriaceae TaxID=543 RepID=UPI002B1B3409|nr:MULTISPECIES: hypothetical protein [Enterobacteriaceae]MEC6500286.1 hypothetical protein [Klebsiella pneumoniae]WRM14455.1 hypothetical protein SOP92_05250 [Enterobacter ludwigii]HEP0986945.1 hypothetical protein [Enterobacter ludwigii]
MNEADNLSKSMLIMVATMKFNKAVDVIIKFVRVSLSSILSFFFGVILVLCFVKTDKLSDSISALANVVMAFAAIMGLVFAKRWKRDATKDKVIDRCVKILSVHLLDIKKNFVPALHISVFNVWFSSFVKKDVTTYKDVRSMKKMASNYVGLIKKESEIYTEFVSELEYLKILSWDVKKEHIEEVDKIRMYMRGIIAKDQELITLINIVFGMWNLNVYNDDESKAFTELPFNLSRDPRVEMALKLIPEMTRERENLQALIEDMLSKQLNVFSFIEQVGH